MLDRTKMRLVGVRAAEAFQAKVDGGKYNHFTVQQCREKKTECAVDAVLDELHDILYRALFGASKDKEPWP